jgi:secondary thiamine-phosphate synthase enzyme
MNTTVMTTAARAARWSVQSSSATEFIDITARVEGIVAASGIATGVAIIQSLHTTAALVVNEYEPLLLADFARFLEQMAPVHGSYEHDDMARRIAVPIDEPANGHAHCRALLLPVSVAVSVIDGRLLLGRWQRIVLVELDGPRLRDVAVVVQGEGQG